MSIKKTLAFDIDGTLFYTSKKTLDNSIEMEIFSIIYYVKVRPYVNILFDYLESNKEHFDIIIYSAAKKEYIEKLLTLIDHKQMISEIYDRDFCDLIYFGNKATYVKKYKRINKNLHNLYLIDDTDIHFNNCDVIGYKCKKFVGDKCDDEIINMIDFINMLKII